MKPFFAKAVDFLPRPLDGIRSIKLKLAILMVASGAIAFAFFRYQIGWLPPRTTVTAVVIALLTSQILAHGMTRPLREMTAVARAMAKGDYTRRIRATARDEVGSLAVAFNQMAADLSTADRQRRELIANVSHELRTPITALNAVLENLVDGVASPDPATLRTALHQTERLGRLVAELLDLSQIDAGTLPLDRSPVDLAGLLAEVAAEAEAMAAAAGRGVRFAVSVTPPGATVPADRERLYQVVLNLLENAARHGPAGEKWRCWRASRPGKRGSRCTTRARESRNPTGTGCSNASPAENAPEAAGPDWGCRSCDGWWNCTAGRSRWSTRNRPRRRLVAEPRLAAGRGAGSGDIARLTAGAGRGGWMRLRMALQRDGELRPRLPRPGSDSRAGCRDWVALLA